MYIFKVKTQMNTDSRSDPNLYLSTRKFTTAATSTAPQLYGIFAMNSYVTHNYVHSNVNREYVNHN